MPNMQYSIDPLNYGPAVAVWPSGTTSNFEVDYPASRVIDIAHPRRVSRSVASPGTTTWGIDLGSGNTLGSTSAILLEGMNFVSGYIRGTNDASNATSPTGNVTVPFSGSFGTDTEDGRVKYLIVLSSGFNGLRYLQFAATGGLPASGYYQIGSIGVFKTLNTLSKNFSLPYEKTILDDAEILEFVQGGREVGVPQPAAIQFACQARMARTDSTALNQFRAMALYPRNKVMLLYENNSDLTKAYHVRRSGSFRMTRTDNGTHTVSGIQLLEVV